VPYYQGNYMKANKFNAKQWSLIDTDSRRSRVRVEAAKIKRSKIKMPLSSEQIEWGIGHNLTWIMGMVGK